MAFYRSADLEARARALLAEGPDAVFVQLFRMAPAVASVKKIKRQDFISVIEFASCFPPTRRAIRRDLLEEFLMRRHVRSQFRRRHDHQVADAVLHRDRAGGDRRAPAR